MKTSAVGRHPGTPGPWRRQPWAVIPATPAPGPPRPGGDAGQPWAEERQAGALRHVLLL